MPFESLDYHLGKPIHTDERVIDKIVYQRRGGGCGQINPAFYFLLQSLGFDITLHHGRVWIGGELYAPYNHILTTVRFDDGSRWIVDTGFGKGSRFPLRLDAEAPQPDPHGTFSTRRSEGLAVDVLRSGKPMYRFYDEPTVLADFEQVEWWFRTSPDSMLLQNMFCSLPIENGWVTLKDDTLIVVNGKDTRTQVFADDAEILEAYEKWFGMTLDRRPTPSPYLRGSVRMAFEEK